MNRHPTNVTKQYFLAGSPTGQFEENIDRYAINADAAFTTTGVMGSVAIVLYAGTVVTNLTFESGATAADTPLNWGFALYSTASTPALIAQTADQTTTAWVANTAKTVALATAYTVPTSGVYYASMWMKATAVCTLKCHDSAVLSANAAWITGEKVLAQTSGSTLTDTAPATIATPTTSRYIPRVVVT